MRIKIFVFLGMACAGALAAQTAPTQESAQPSVSAPAVAPTASGKIAGTRGSALSMPVFHEAASPDVFAAAQKMAPRETRTPAQLEALMKTYVGHWQGESRQAALGAPHLIRDPVDMVCTLADENGVAVLTSVNTYTEGRQTLKETQRMWVQGGRIVSEIRTGTEILRLVAHTQGNKLVWISLDAKKTLLDFYQAESIDLTVAGGKMHVDGFEVQYTPQGSALIYSSTDLTLVK